MSHRFRTRLLMKARQKRNRCERRIPRGVACRTNRPGPRGWSDQYRPGDRESIPALRKALRDEDSSV
ncbi:hypothetical protein, partial [Thermogutta sp.]|uniref:hypothetical protein n=1 Tax=Thermogutta sp. TaxID=1962930 RepID=UPI0025CDDE52